MEEKNTCPDCGSKKIVMIEYPYDNPNYYDGVSEISCQDCKTRHGRWSGRFLKDGDYEGKWGFTPKPSKSKRGGEKKK